MNKVMNETIKEWMKAQAKEWTNEIIKKLMDKRKKQKIKIKWTRIVNETANEVMDKLRKYWMNEEKHKLAN